MSWSNPTTGSADRVGIGSAVLVLLALSSLAAIPTGAQAPGDVWQLQSLTPIRSVTLVVSIENEAVDLSGLNSVVAGPVSVRNEAVSINIRSAIADPVSIDNEIQPINIRSAVDGPIGVQNDAP